MTAILRNVNVLTGMSATVLFLVGVVLLPLLLRTPRPRSSMLRCFFVVGTVAAFSDTLASSFLGVKGLWPRIAVSAGSSLSLLSMCALLVIFTRYLHLRIIGGHTRREPIPDSKDPLVLWVYLVSVLMTINTLAVYAGRVFFLDPSNSYHHYEYFVYGESMVALALAGDLAIVVRHRRLFGRRRLVTLVVSITLIIAVCIVRLLVYPLNLSLLVISVASLVVLVDMRENVAREHRKQDRALAQTRHELVDARIDAATSQIQPHFFGNALGTIHYLCLTAPETAAHFTELMADHLRAMADASGSDACVPVADELLYVDHYLEMRHISSPDRVHYRMDVQTSDFVVPPLSILTLVENAVDHGIGSSRNGGTVVVETREHVDRFEINVIDDGKGFAHSQKASTRTHVGLENARYRVEQLCSGTLVVRDEKDRGTRVTISIPKRGSERCEYRSNRR